MLVGVSPIAPRDALLPLLADLVRGHVRRAGRRSAVLALRSMQHTDTGNGRTAETKGSINNGSRNQYGRLRWMEEAQTREHMESRACCRVLTGQLPALGLGFNSASTRRRRRACGTGQGLSAAASTSRLQPDCRGRGRGRDRQRQRQLRQKPRPSALRELDRPGRPMDEAWDGDGDRQRRSQADDNGPSSSLISLCSSRRLRLAASARPSMFGGVSYARIPGPEAQ